MIPSLHKSKAFSLVETTIALGIVSFALTAILGLLPIGLTLSRGALDQTTANGILTDVVSDLRSTPAIADQSERFEISIPDVLSSGTPLYFDDIGQFGTTLNADSRYRLDVSFIPGDHINAPMRVALHLRWPAAADLSDSSGGVKTVVTLTRVQ